VIYGVQYYPEQWPEERWELDARLMAEAGVNTVRMGEFAWSAYEPEEGRFDFAWMDRVLELMRGRGIGVIMCTCSRTPPPWLYARHPSISNVDIDGIGQRAGGRYAYCPSSREFADLALAIDSQVVAHFAGHPAIVGWQIDNEVGGGNDCYCDGCLGAFREHLRERHGNTDVLNERWGAHFWSLRFSSFDDVPMVRPRMPNPQLALAYRRFQSHLNCEFVRLRAELIRKHDPGRWITTNFQSGRVQHTDYNAMSRHLDVNGLNYYPARSPELVLDYYRGPRGRMLVLEQFTRLEPVDSGPGWMRLWAWQAFAHGAMGVNFFRWRVSTHGQEMHRDGILPQAGQTARRYEELARMGTEIARIGGIVDATAPAPEVAITYNYASRWAMENVAIEGAGVVEEAELFHDAMLESNIPVDALDPGEDLGRYRLVFAPRLFLIDENTARRLLSFVRGGGILCLTAGTGVVDEWGRCFLRPRPGPLAEAAGIEVSDMAALEESVRLMGLREGLSGWQGRGRSIADELHTKTADVIAVYSSGWREGRPAVTANRFGRGEVIYVGTALDAPSVRALVARLTRRSGISPFIDTPDGVRAYRRASPDREVLFLINTGAAAATVPLGGCFDDLLNGGEVTAVAVKPADLAIVARSL
jgi:beta-galactosidase